MGYKSKGNWWMGKNISQKRWNGIFKKVQDNNYKKEMTDKPKPCPFCGSVDVELHRNFDYVFCKDCGERGTCFDGHPIDAINAWNSLYKKDEKKNVI